MIESFLS